MVLKILVQLLEKKKKRDPSWKKEEEEEIEDSGKLFIRERVRATYLGQKSMRTNKPADETRHDSF